MSTATVRLKHVAAVRVSNVDKKSNDSEPPVRLCNYTDVYYADRITADRAFMAATATPEQIATFRLQRGQTLITKDSEVAEDIGIPAFVDVEAPDLVCGYHLAQITPDQAQVVPRFLFWAVASSRSREQFTLGASGVTRFGLRMDTITGLEVPLPELAQQRRIAYFLDAETARIDALITAKQQMIGRSEERDEAALSAWWQRATARHGVVAIRRLGAVVEQGWSPACLAEPAALNEWGVLKTSAVTPGVFDPLANKRLPDGTQPDLRWQVAAGDLLMVRGSGSRKSVGAVVVADPGERLLTISDLIYRIRGLAGPPEFHAAALRSAQVRQVIEGTFRTDAGQTLKLRSDDIRDLPHPNVPVDVMPTMVQELLAETNPSRRLRQTLTRQIELLRERRQALITAAVSGELPV